MSQPPLGGPAFGLQLFGIPVWIHWSFPAVGLGVSIPIGLLALFASSELALSVFMWTTGAAAALVVVHELGHALVARLLSIEVTAVVLAAAGGCCLVEDVPSTARDLLFSAGGLAAQGALFAGTAACLWVFGAPSTVPLNCAVIVFTVVNLLMLMLNAVPSANSDGARIGRALRALRAPTLAPVAPGPCIAQARKRVRRVRSARVAGEAARCRSIPKGSS